MRNHPRPRRELHPLVFGALRPLLRFSYSREAWVLIGVGRTFGPVVRPREAKPAKTSSSPEPKPARPNSS